MRIDGALQIDGPCSSVTLTGQGESIAFRVAGKPPLPTRRRLIQVARFAEDHGLQILVTDENGRRLADVGVAGSSVLGRLMTGSGAIRPSLRGAALGVRAAIGRRQLAARPSSISE